MPAKYTPEQRIAAFWDKVDKSAGDDACWIWTANLSDGYGRVNWKGRMTLAHRVSWELEYGAPPSDLYVLHQCDNRKCCNVRHLFLGTHDDNSADMVAKGRGNAPRGESNPMCKVTDAQVAEIRQRYSAGGIRQKDLGKEYGLSQAQVGKITQRIWRK